MRELNEKIFEELFYKYYDRVYAGLLAKKCTPDVAQELTQVTFIKVWEYRSSFSFGVQAEAQLFKKARQVFIDWLRKEAHQRKLVAALQQLPQPNAPSKIELTDSLQKALEQLPPMQKKVFALAYEQGFSHREIAEQLGISVKTVDRHVYKSLRQLRKILAFVAVSALIGQAFT